MNKWNVGQKGEYGTYNVNMVFDENGDAIAQVYGLPQHWTLEQLMDEHREALNNAFIISASPELLNACEMAEYCLNPDNEEIVTNEDRQRTMDAIISALSKAKAQEKK